MASVRVVLGLVFKCGAFIYNDRWIISAAHCTINETASTVSAYVGTKFNVLSLLAVAYPLEKIEYNNYNETSKANDICLLKTKNKIAYSSTVQPIALDATLIGAGVKATIIGWGSILVSSISNSRVKSRDVF